MNKYRTVDVQTPANGRQVYLDYWWLCENGDPKKALFLNASAQCNKNKQIVEMVWNGAWKAAENLKIVKIPIAYLPIRN
jgi:hypothetical protein